MATGAFDARGRGAPRSHALGFALDARRLHMYSRWYALRSAELLLTAGLAVSRQVAASGQLGSDLALAGAASGLATDRAAGLYRKRVRELRSRNPLKH
jgi:hypothetical protein